MTWITLNYPQVATSTLPELWKQCQRKKSPTLTSHS